MIIILGPENQNFILVFHFYFVILDKEFISSLDEKIYFEFVDELTYSLAYEKSKHILLFDGNEIKISGAKILVKQENNRVHHLLINDKFFCFVLKNEI